jgi:hypothetical protein
MNLSTVLAALSALGPIAARLPEFVALFHEAVVALGAEDQATAKEALADIQADNDEGHARLQAKLAAAAR